MGDSPQIRRASPSSETAPKKPSGSPAVTARSMTRSCRSTSCNSASVLGATSPKRGPPWARSTPPPTHPHRPPPARGEAAAGGAGSGPPPPPPRLVQEGREERHDRERPPVTEQVLQ